MVCGRKRRSSGTMSPDFTRFDLNLLPETILLRIFSYLDYDELLVCRNVSKDWRRVSEDRYLWRCLNLSCKRIQSDNWIFRLPIEIRDSVKVVNLMWAYIAISAFNCMKARFRNAEVLLMQHCKFSVTAGDEGTNSEPLPLKLRVLDVRDIHGKWFDDIGPESAMLTMEGMAFSQSMPSDWISQLSMTWLPKLRVLHIQNNPSLSDTFLTGITRNTPLLEAICVHGCMYVTGSFLKEAIEKLVNLSTLDLNGTRLEGKYVKEVNWSKSRIFSLNISFCCKLTEADLIYMLPKLRYLRYLQASFCGWGRAFTDKVVQQISHDKRLALEALEVQSTFAMSAQGLAQLCKNSPCLHYLRVGTVMKTSKELALVLECVAGLRSLSIQMGDSKFSATHLFDMISVACKGLETLFLYNFSFESCIEPDLQQSLINLFTCCKKLKNFFTGGYPYSQKLVIDDVICTIATSLGRKMNVKQAVQILPSPDASFDKLLCRSISKPTYNASSMKRSIHKAINCQAFYKSGIQKLDDYHFYLLRNS